MNRPESLPGGESPEAAREPGLLRRVGTKVLAAVRTPEPKNARTLPQSILYAMANRKAQLHERDIETLQRADFPRLAFYLSVKAADEDDAVQMKLLQRAADLAFDYRQLSIEDMRPALDLMSTRGTAVAGEKLGQFSRHGLDHSLIKFNAVLDHALEQKPESTPLFMVANYPFIAMDILAAHSLEHDAPLGVLKPERLEQTELPVGFMIEPHLGGLGVRALRHDFERPSPAVIFDDVVRTGHAKEIVMDFWAKGSGQTPDFVTAITVTSDI